jgi:hypothetical protein
MQTSAQLQRGVDDGGDGPPFVAQNDLYQHRPDTTPRV